MTPAEIIAERARVNWTQPFAAESVHVALRTWKSWELGERHMPAGLWELFLLKTGRRVLTRAA